MSRQKNPSKEDLIKELTEICKQLVYINTDVALRKNYNAADMIDKARCNLEEAIDHIVD